MLTVDVNNVLTQLSLTEVHLDSMDGLVSSLDTTVEEYNPDCFILVYAVDDKDSFGEQDDVRMIYLIDNPHQS